MRLPFDNKYAPLTDCVGFIKCPVGIALEKYLEWVVPQIQKGIDMKIVEPERGWNSDNSKLPVYQQYSESFPFLLEQMVPFNYPEKVCIFECANGWTGYFENRRITETRRIAQIGQRVSDTQKSITVKAWANKGNKIVNGWGGEGCNILLPVN